MSDTQALIEEARRVAHYTTGPYHANILTRLADALESSEAARRDLADKIEALAERWASMKERFDPRKSLTPESSAYWDARDDTFDQCADELRGLVSGDKKEQR